jgi:hypothetical protein
MVAYPRHRYGIVQMRPVALCKALRAGFGLCRYLHFHLTEGENEMPIDPPIDRSLTITVTATSNWLGSGPTDLGANISYEETASKPNYPNAIDSQGNIYLKNMSSDPKYTNNLDITLILNAQMTDRSGNPISARWALPTEGSGTYPTPEGFCWFCASSTNWQPIAMPAGMALIRNGDTSITIDDNTTGDFLNYTFCMGLMVPPVSNHFITIEPIIVSKGVSKPPTASLAPEKC